MHTNIIVAYMTSKYSSLDDLKNFLANYKKYKSGSNHKLVVCFKNLDSKEIDLRKNILNKISYEQFIDKEKSNDYEWGTLKRLCEIYYNKEIFWLNDYSYPIRDNWLKIILDKYNNNKVIGCSSSFSSHYANSFYREKSDNIIIYLLKIIVYFFLFPNFPNPHIRTTGFLINSIIFLNYINKKKKVRNKLDALIIESGYRGLSNYLIKNNYEVKIVNSHSKSYDLRSSYKSETFAFKDKNLALISDNQMRIYLNLDKKLKKKKRLQVWGNLK